MKKILVLCSFAVALASRAPGGPVPETGAGHVTAAPETIEWKPFGGPFTWAILSGDPNEKGSPFVIRIKHPDGAKVPPHWHPIDEHMTVLTGKFHIGTGDSFDAAKTDVLGPGAYAVMPKKMHHFAVGEGETIVQVHGIGPFTTNFVNPADDPRNQKPH